MSEPLTLSQSAAERIRAISEREGKSVMLRIAVEGGGCSGFQYQFDLVDQAEADDLKIERDGSTALVDIVSLALLRSISSTSWPAPSFVCATPTPSPAAAAASAFRSDAASSPIPLT
jgi:iron-sulfur cluster assembly accessory protein